MYVKNIQLTDKLVGEIKGEFYIPSYQRGYRWNGIQVKALLDDVYENGNKPYCLQPIVIRKTNDNVYEVIDGQQRLTTLYIIFKYVSNRWPDYFDAPNYTITYETREENVEFFERIEDEELANKNIDFYFIHCAYKTVEQWLNDKHEQENRKKINLAGDLTKYLLENVKVIWYEMQSDSEADAISLFTRLNIGRIPLTNAELIKALFLCRHNDNDKFFSNKQMEIALQWDTIERELHDEDFWYFLTRKKSETYPTRIELLFDFMAEKKEDERDQFATFLWFSKQHDNLPQLWENILQYYYRLKEWHKRDELYHKIGYLVSSGMKTIDTLMSETKELHKSDVYKLLDAYIKSSINFSKPYAELSYENDYDKITNILLLFNVVSLIKNGSNARFPFKEFNTKRWSLEHIHAQNSLKLNTQVKWKQWLKHHIESVKCMECLFSDNEKDSLLNEMEKAIENENLTDREFTNLSDRITSLLSEKNGNTEYVHSLSNMALLQASANSALNNGLFDAKRRAIIKMDMEGKYIPYCTKMVFLKYYTSMKHDDVNFYFWAEDDRKAYIVQMNEVLKDYLKEEIAL